VPLKECPLKTPLLELLVLILSCKRQKCEWVFKSLYLIQGYWRRSSRGICPFLFAIHYYVFLLSLKHMSILFVSQSWARSSDFWSSTTNFSLFPIVYLILLFLGRESDITIEWFENLSMLLLTLYILQRNWWYLTEGMLSLCKQKLF
jgi:hypothetical protein